MDTLNNKDYRNEIPVLFQIAKILSVNLTREELITSINKVFSFMFEMDSIKIWIYDDYTESIRDFSKNWEIIDKKIEQEYLFRILSSLDSLKGDGFILNSKLFSMRSREDEIHKCLQEQTVEKHMLILPILDRNIVIGFIAIVSDSIKPYQLSSDSMLLLNIVLAQVSSAVINMRLREQMQLNVEFHKAMKDIAKIIESQYEINYIIPLIGEMMDKFIFEPLIYVFAKDLQGVYKLLWPSVCNIEGLEELIYQAEKAGKTVISSNNKIGVFPLVTDEETIGAIVADDIVNKLSSKEVEYLEQLSRQAAITIQKANNYADILQQATIDALTGLNNRRQFETRLAQETSIAKRKNQPLCCMMIDVDFFKKVNDVYGHTAGDQILQQVGELIKGAIRVYDTAARYGGEEFCILLPDTPMEQAEMIAERLRKKVETTRFEICSFSDEKNTLSVTVSIGISQFSPDFIDHRQLYEQADGALYKAKQQGRNRVIVAG